LPVRRPECRTDGRRDRQERRAARSNHPFGPATAGWVRGFTSTSDVLKRLEPAAAARAVERLRQALAAHLTDAGVWFNSRAWIVTAERAAHNVG
jgi:hypothetical protein